MLKAKSGRLYENLDWRGFKYCRSDRTCRMVLGTSISSTSAHIYVNPPIIGEMHLASAALFDVGVYVTVVGAVMLMISVLGNSRHSGMSGPLPKE